MADSASNTDKLELEAVNGFNGQVYSGLIVHPDTEHLIYPLGPTIILKRIKDGKQEFFQGHTKNVCSISVSKSGSYIASGQVNSMGFKAPVIIWDYAQRVIYTHLELHKVKVESVSFSPSEKYLVSLGGLDDGRIIVWDIESQQAICACSSSAFSDVICLTLKYSNTNDNMFVSAGNGPIIIWEIDLPNRRIRPTPCHAGKLKRKVKCIEITEDDEFMFCGTTSGDIIKFNLKTGLLNTFWPNKKKCSQGVQALKMLTSGDFLVGTGAGIVFLNSGSNFKILKQVQLQNCVTSVTAIGEGQQFFVGTDAAEIYCVNFENFKSELSSTCHNSTINGVTIPVFTSDLFLTWSKDDIRLWLKHKPKDILRMTIPNMTCNTVDIMFDGQSIITGWNDGKIRTFNSVSGHLMRTIDCAHINGVTAIAGMRDNKRIVSGGEEGQVCVWELLTKGHRLLESMKQHRAAVNCIKITSDDRQCVSASSDGSCIIWDLERFERCQIVLANTLFKTVVYHPEEFHIVTSGTDRQITYWDVLDGSIIRVLQGSLSETIYSMDITQDGQHFVTGGGDGLVKVWDYMRGEVTHVGIAPGGAITGVKIHHHTVVTTSIDGAILTWRFPYPKQ
ncbi:cilia- and flagella-associated protein 52 [Thalassophryne amazonica]|uniref:cilia- and flagella-associated protein 52 n=1 Tax=Thalassophryne amazonica TaxID=390379 RepID=UPI001471CF02|nr:cilia- and flagella-associated protein 52 [Thalassophryne amazonica]